MTVPGLALFYGGLVRAKNMLSVLMQVFVDLLAALGAVGALRLQPGLQGGTNAIVGGFSHAFLAGIKPDTVLDSNGVVIPEYMFMVFQLTFAAITPALIIGAFAERMKFSAVLWFMALWFTFVYAPIAHMVVWGGRRGSSRPRRRRTSPAALWCTSMPGSQGWWPAWCWASASATARRPCRRTA